MTGSTVTHINMISSVALASIVLHSTLQTRVYGVRAIPFLVSWTVLLLPLLLSMTLFANKPAILSFLLLIPPGLILLRTSAPESAIIPPPSSARSAASMTPTTSRFPTEVKPGSLKPLPAITTYRAHMMLMTVLGILAVDFPVFPRTLAKCESYGVSLMDLGVGSFVFSNGVVSAIPLLKDPAHLNAPLLPKVTTVVRKTLPIIALGVVRVLLVKGTDYPEHETEYGVHWNFFISLALLPVLQVLLHPLIRVVPASLLGIGVGILQQLALSVFGLKDYVRTAPRLNLISANKEGIASLGGYLSIHLLGLSIGTLILPPSPNFFRRLRVRRSTPAELGAPRQKRQRRDRAGELCNGVANLPYALWIAAFNTSYILGYLVLDMVFFPAPYVPKKAKPAPASVSPSTTAPLLEAINKNALPLFLLANILTGLVNLSMQTMYAGPAASMGVLSFYALVVSGVAWRLRETRVWRL
ncbi:GPI-anchored wall transfer protein [Mycena venus]|uniref:GPI-anchored wall transfer protein n=1 Tax=Mycena venus TaxID=2733690 RepID=A0A8H7D5M5_9AGAR|nr:GPI-anchored wall transfer protein [Mycena venus]